MIEVKRNCSSSIKYDTSKDVVSFGDFTIRITGRHSAQFDWLKIEYGIGPQSLLADVIAEGLDTLYNEGLLQELHNLENRSQEPIKPRDYRPEVEQ